MITFRRALDYDSRPRRLRGLDGYLREYLNVKDPQLTQVVTILNEELEEAYESRVPYYAEGKSTLPAGFPWITPVLGSGAVDPGLVDGGAPLIRRVRRLDLVFGDATLPDSSRRAEVAQRFAVALIEERLGADLDDADADALVREARAQGDDDPPDKQPVDARERSTAELLLAVALLTRLYQQVMLTATAPVPRWEDEEPRPIDSGDPGLNLGLVAPAEEVLSALCTDTNTALGGGVRRLLEERLEELKGPKCVSLANLRLLTEYAWFYLARECLTYPGWSDLMLTLTVERDPIPHQEGRPRPVYDAFSGTENPEEMRAQYFDVAHKSWDARDSSRGRIHDVVAALLKRQAVLQHMNTGPAAAPLATAFVTGFDLELELALLALRQRFVLAVPYLVAERDTSKDVSMLWIGHIVDAEAAPLGDELRAFELAKCTVLSGADQFGRTDTQERGVPIVVRLTGCPAIAPPVLTDDANDKLRHEVTNLLGWSETAVPTLEGLFVLDEYVSSSLGMVESFLDHLDRARLGLPRWIQGTPGGVNAMFARFWLVVGAQLGDSSIRQRILAQLAATAISSPAPRARPKRAGVVVNRRIGVLDGRLMEWQGFDIVKGEGTDLIPHLEHYLVHLDRAIDLEDARKPNLSKVRCEPLRVCSAK